MVKLSHLISLALILSGISLLSGCLAVSAAKTTMGVAGQAAETTIKTTGAVGGAVIPNSSKKD